MAREQQTPRTKKGTRKQDAAHKDRKKRHANNYVSFSEWLRIRGAQTKAQVFCKKISK
jgi:hypothetical protein